MTSLPSNNDFDVPLDWLYKGKRKSKLRPIVISTNSKSINQTNVDSHSSASKTATTAISTTVDNNNDNNDNVTSDKVQSNTVDKRPRSSSISYGSLNNLSNSKNVNNSLSNSKTENGKVTDIEKSNNSSSISVRNRSFSMPHIVDIINNPSSTANNSNNNSNNSNNNRHRSSLFTSNNNNLEGKKKSRISSLFSRRNSVSANHSTNDSHHDSNKKDSVHVPHISTSTSTTNLIDDNFSPNSVGNNIPLHVDSPNFHLYASPSSASPVFQQHFPHENIMVPIEHLSSSKSTLNQLLNVPLKRVTFAVDKFEGDPPQQLPSRKPKIGNVLIPDDMVSDIPSISAGIANIGDENNNSQPKITKDSKEYKHAVEVYNRNLKESIKHQQEAHKAAEKMAKEVKSFNEKVYKRNSLSLEKEQYSLFTDSNENDDGKKISNNTTNGDNNDEDNPISDHSTFVNMSNNNIDKQLNVHEHYFQQIEEFRTSSILTLDIIYTRCCHLREILPIPSTLRQLKEKTAPLHVLKFLNPRPTLIDILSFCDFIAIVPIHNVIFDNVTLNSRMLRIVLSSLVNSTTLEKIGLRNVVITQNDWPFFCKFLFKNESLTKLDISQTKTKSDLSLKDHREHMDWNLLTDVIKLRKGKPLEELLLNGIKLIHIPLSQFQNLLTVFGEKYRQFYSEVTGLSLASSTGLQFNGSDNTGVRLGLAATEITEDYLVTVLNWMSRYSVQGVDLSFNNLNPFLRIFAKKFSKLPFKNLQYFTLNNTNISNVADLALLLKYLSRLPNLKYLDLSNIPDVFPGIIPYIYKYLPRFPNLKRIHIDNNNLRYRQIIVLCSILSKCKTLSHVSLLYELKHNDTYNDRAHSNGTVNTGRSENNFDSHKSIYKHQFFTRNTVWATLYALVRDSPNLFSLDIDYDQVSDEIQSRIALCLMRNMQHAVNSDFQVDALSSQDQLLFDGSLVAETADDVLKKLNSNTLMDKDPHLVATKKYILKKYFEKLENLLQNVQETIDNVFKKRKTGDLPSKEKENLLRLLLLEKNLKNIIEIATSRSTIPNNIKDSFVSLINNGNEQSMTSVDISRPLLKHLDSARLMAEVVGEDDHENDSTVPHTVATEDNNKIVDINTGIPILYKSTSSTSLQNKLQEKEEGELHKWGFFVQQQRSIYPSDKVLLEKEFKAKKNGDKDNESKTMYTSHKEDYVPELPTPNLDSGASTLLSPKILPRIPSGEELRKAIIKAKGMATMDELIQNVAANKQELEKIYNAAYFLTGKTKSNEDDKNEKKK